MVQSLIAAGRLTLTEAATVASPTIHIVTDDRRK
jgi:hypothetical protein